MIKYISFTHIDRDTHTKLNMSHIYSNPVILFFFRL